VLGEQEHVLLITQHHIVSDGWSIGILLREMSALYGAFSRGADDPLAPLTLQYADYAVWQRAWLHGEELQRQLDFWLNHLRGAPALLELPADRTRPAVQSYAGGHLALTLPETLSDQLRALSRQHGTTLFMTMLAGWSLLLARLSGQDDVVIGTPVANRQRREVEDMIGFFVNTLALRVRLDGDLDVAQLLARVKDTTLDAYAHQDLPFEQVVEALAPARSLGHSPVFQAMLALNNTPDSGEFALPGLSLQSVGHAHQTTQTDLSLAIVDMGDTIGCGIEYASDLFDEATVRRWAAHFQVLLAAMADPAAAGMPVAALPLLSAPERAHIVRDFNRDDATYACHALGHRGFEQHAAAQPDAEAVVDGERSLSYGELNRCANRLAHYLVGLGVRPEDRVAICVERGIEMIVAILAVLKAGAAYVPLDPGNPAERLAFIFADSAPTVVLTQAALRDRMGEAPVPVLLLDALPGPVEACPSTDPDAGMLGLTGAHTAYLLYTSGSTGQPKGVMVEHAQLANLIGSHMHMCAYSAQDRYLQFASFGFDSSVVEIFPALSSGGALVLRQASMVAPDGAFAAFLERHRITEVNLPTSFWHQWTLEIAEGRCLPPASLRLVVIGGEKAERRNMAHWFAALGERRCPCINTYGPTEATVYVTAVAYDSAESLPDGEIPIGRPVGRARVHVLDALGQVVPVGVAGEIHIAGPAVARGYFGRADLTLQRFVADPFEPAPGARMYKTGDLGRWLPDGHIEFLGRNDFQVKLRGYRIELGEIEARLSACSGVREAVVVAREDRQGHKQLVAYLVPQQGHTVDPAALRAQIGTGLADYMVPTAMVALDAIPRNHHGKLDRDALPAPDQAALATSPYEAPQGEIEQALAATWQGLLGLERVGRNDHFFELGGHSLLATQLVARIRAGFDVELPLMTVFRTPTLAALGAAVATLQIGRYAEEDVARIAADMDGMSEAELQAWLDKDAGADGAKINLPEVN
jgi:amino acid adenylation domain-containing protein